MSNVQFSHTPHPNLKKIPCPIHSNFPAGVAATCPWVWFRLAAGRPAFGRRLEKAYTELQGKLRQKRPEGVPGVRERSDRPRAREGDIGLGVARSF